MLLPYILELKSCNTGHDLNTCWFHIIGWAHHSELFVLHILVYRLSNTDDIGKLVISQRLLSLMIEIGTKRKAAQNEGNECDAEQSDPCLWIIITGNRACEFGQISFSAVNRIFFLLNLMSKRRQLMSNWVVQKHQKQICPEIRRGCPLPYEVQKTWSQAEQS